MSNPLDKIKKLKGRSLKEIQTRGGQAVAAYTEKIGIAGKLLDDSEIVNVIKPSAFAPSVNISAEILLERFYEEGTENFFPSIANIDETIGLLGKVFSPRTNSFFIGKADKIVDNRHDLLGYQNLDFGNPVDWHFEPVTETHSPVKHWKQFDEGDSRETGDKKIIWELNRHNHFFVLGLAYRLTGEERYAECFAQHLDSWIPRGT
jgi:hypothetical protein